MRHYDRTAQMRFMNLEVEEIAFVNPHAALQPFCGSVEHCGCGYRHRTGSLVSSRRGTLGITTATITCFTRVKTCMHVCFIKVIHMSPSRFPPTSVCMDEAERACSDLENSLLEYVERIVAQASCTMCCKLRRSIVPRGHVWQSKARLTTRRCLGTTSDSNQRAVGEENAVVDELSAGIEAKIDGGRS
jgi:hypothetical protein